MELTRTPETDPVAFERAQQLFAALGRETAEVEDVPGLVSGRVVCQLINEAYFTSSAPADVDAAMKLGVAHPAGRSRGREAIGLPQVVATLDALHRVLGDPRYRVAPQMRRDAAMTFTP